MVGCFAIRQSNECDPARSSGTSTFVPPDEIHLLEVVRVELRLLDPGLRGSHSEVRALLHPDFVEFGASGRVGDRDEIAIALAVSPAVSGQALDFAPVELAPNVVLLTYRIAGEHGPLRSSLWMRKPTGGWLLRFHQGTRAAVREGR
jgi:hypothetical protein